MAINLLPSEEKSKAKKQKKQLIPQIELTYPEKAKKGKPGVRKAGVLTFFKQAFTLPKKEVKEEAEKKKMLPEKKIIFEEKFIFTKPKKEVRPKVHLYKSTKEKLKPKSSSSLGQRISRLFSSLFSKKNRPVKKDEKKPAPHFIPEDKFPKYKAVRAEKIIPPPKKPKARPVAVIEVVTKESAPHKKKEVHLPSKEFPKVEPKLKIIKELEIKSEKSEKKGISAWQGFIKWLKGIFGLKPKKLPTVVKPVEPKKKQVEAPPLPKEKPIVFQKEKLVIPEKKLKELKPEPVISARKEKPFRIEDKFKAPSFITPPPPKPEEKKEEKPIIKKEVAKAPMPPPKEKELAKETPEEKKEFPSAKAMEDKKKEKTFSLKIWLAAFWQTIKSLFSRLRKTEAVPLPPTPLLKEKKETEPIKVKKQEKEIGVPKGEKISPTPSPPPEKEPKGFQLTQPPEAPPPTALDWEINLVPEEALERKIPKSSWLYLILFVIIAAGLVFGGWIGVNWYYNTITTKINKVNQKISTTEMMIKSYDKLREEVEDLRQLASHVQVLLDEHVYWSAVFFKLEEYTLPDVYYTGMTADVNGAVALTAIGKDYETAIKQLFVFEEASDFVASVTVSDITFVDVASELTEGTETEPRESGDETVSFNINLMVHPEIFFYP